MTTPPWGPPQPQPRRSKPGYGKIAGIGCAGITGLFILSAVIAGIADSTKNTAATRPATTASTASPTPSASPSPTPSDSPTVDPSLAKAVDYLYKVDQERHARDADQRLTQALAARCTDDPLVLAFAATPVSIDVMAPGDDHADVYRVLDRLRTDLPGSGMVGCQARLPAVKRALAPKPTPKPTPTHSATSSGSTSGGTSGGTVDNHGGATALCVDGTLSYSQHHSGTCSHHHGVAVWYR